MQGELPQPPKIENDYLKHLSEAKQKILKRYPIWEQLIMRAATDSTDRDRLWGKPPSEIVRYYIQSLIQDG